MLIVKIKINDELTMLFGDSYKPWYMQFDEWIWLHKDLNIKPVEVKTSANKWIGWGGLKWCPENMFQDQLNREGCQENEADNLNPRKYSNMKFVDNPIVSAKVNKIIKQFKTEHVIRRNHG